MQWCLVSKADANKEWLVTITSSPFIIGRTDDCDLKLIDKRISRHHSEIRISGDLLWIRDLRSMNGTFVNQIKIEHAQLLEAYDTISIGKYEFRVTAISSTLSIAENETICATLPDELKGLDITTFESRLRMLLDKRNVIPHFQPVVNFPDITTVGYEILGRGGDEELPSNPAELLDLADCLGCASELSAIFREAGVTTGKKIPGHPILFVNSTKFEIHQMETLLASMQRIRDMAPSNKIVLEINEKTAAGAEELPQLRAALEKLDIGLAFDDFGVGQTRLVELSNTPPDYLKFDLSLIRKIHIAPKRLHQMISTFIKASHDLGILTLAEGIECLAESKVCQELGFDLGQGYFFGRPAPVHELDTKNRPGIHPRASDQRHSDKIYHHHVKKFSTLN